MRVLIIGGGYGGVALARALHGRAEVILVERREVFYHAVAALRAAADPAWLDRILIPYDRVPGVLHDEVVALEPPGGVRLAGAGRLEADAVVLATGSSYAFPGKTTARTTAEIRAEHAELHGRLRSARRIAILGGGPVGVELAGELATRLRGPQVTLVEARPTLANGPFSPALGAALHAALTRVGVEVITGATAPPDGADVTLAMTGARPSPLAAAAGLPVDAAGRVLVGPDLAIPGVPGWYALGDATAIPEPKVLYLAEAHAAMLAENLLGARRTWTPWRSWPLFVPVGDRDGAAQLPFGGLVVGGWLTSLVKGRGLFVEKRWKKLGHAGAPS